MRAAVVGANWGAAHVAALRENGVEVVALGGRDRARTRKAAEGMDIPRAVTDLSELHRLDLDLVSVATPAASHVEVITALPDLPIICEKPAVGDSPPATLPTARTAPVWVNYAFPFLDVARAAARALPRIGTPWTAYVRSNYDLGEQAGGRRMFFELVPHPWSWVAQVLGATGAPRGPRPPAGPGAVAIRTTCGAVPVELEAVPRPGLRGILHEISIDGEGGCLHLSGIYRIGSEWRFNAPTIQAGSSTEPVGPTEVGPPDPWYRANARSIGAAVEAVRGEVESPQLYRWQDALQLDLTAQAELNAG